MALRKIVTFDPAAGFPTDAASGSDEFDASGQRISNVQDPVLPQDAATKEYVDQLEITNSSSTRSVASTISNTTLFVANPLRGGATVLNDSKTNIFVKLGANATLTDFTVKMRPGAYYEVPYGYVGQIDAIWDVVDPSGAARLTELTDA